MALFLRKSKHQPKRILISRTDRIGDFVLALPVFEAVKQNLDVHLAVLCNEMVKPLLDHNPFVDQIITVKPNCMNSQAIESIEMSEFDTLLVLVNDPIILKLLPELKRIPIRIGPLSKPGALLQFTHPVIQKRSRSVKNEAEYNLELLRFFQINRISNLKPQLYLTPGETDAFKIKYAELLAKVSHSQSLLVFHPGMSGSALNLEFKAYHEILAGMTQLPVNICLTGSGEDEHTRNQELIRSIDTSKQDSLIDFSNRLSLRELAILISISKLFIGPSTGPTHLANAVNTPLITFYPPIKVQSARRWAPFKADAIVHTPEVPCGQKYRCIREKCPHFYCMDLIEPGIVIKQIKDLIRPT